MINKNLVIFATGASPYKEKSFTSEEQKQVKDSYIRGGFNYSRLNFTNIVLMSFFKWSLLKPKEKRTPDEIGMLASYDHPVDYTKKEIVKKF
ncbi:MAG: hypothetical protein KAR44_14340 [Candidatus Aegiribacteria sp.]|nr:hypothetical protein [Candidatus Aegiribacteria sp.]